MLDMQPHTATGHTHGSSSPSMQIGLMPWHRPRSAGGESTTMALVAERWGLIPELQKFAKMGKPIWGTCAGMIFLAERADGTWASPVSEALQVLVLACGWI